MSFTDVTDNIRTALKTDTDLATFIAAKFKRPLNVIKAFRQRQEITPDQMPIIMITRPKMKSSPSVVMGNKRDRTSTVVLFLGFHSEDKEKAADLAIQFEECVEAVLRKDYKRGGLALDTDPNESENDFGIYAPFYFTVMAVDIQQIN